MIWEIYCLTKVIVEVCLFPLSSSTGEVKEQKNIIPAK